MAGELFSPQITYQPIDLGVSDRFCEGFQFDLNDLEVMTKVKQNREPCGSHTSFIPRGDPADAANFFRAAQQRAMIAGRLEFLIPNSTI